MSQTEYREPSGWATGAVLFAGILMIIIGIFEAFQGLNAIFEDQFYVVTENYIFDIDVTAWGWIHLILGVLVIFGGYAVMAGRTWGRILALILAAIAAIANFAVHPLLPLLVDPHDRPRNLGDLGAHEPLARGAGLTRRVASVSADRRHAVRGRLPSTRVTGRRVPADRADVG